MKRGEFEYEFEVECPHGTVDYVIKYTVDPGEPERGPSYSSGGEPGYPPCIEDASAYYVRRDRHGKKTLERRPELDDAVSEDTLLEHAGATEEAAREAAAEAHWEARRDR